MGPSRPKTESGNTTEAHAAELRSSLLRAARKHFALHGYQGASLKAIAEEAGVANSLINYHFHGKEGLFRQCIELFAQERMETFGRILEAAPQSKEELRVRLELFVDEIIRSVIDDPHGFDILQQEIKAGNPLVVKLFENTLLKGFKTVMGFFAEGQAKGLIRADLDPMILASILMSSTCDTTRKDALGEAFFNVSFKQAEWRQSFSRHIVILFLQGVLT